MKKTYSKPTVETYVMTSEEFICVSLSDDAADGTPAGVRRRTWKKDEDFYMDDEEDFED